MKKHYTICQLAKELGVCKNTIFYWLKTGKIKEPRREKISGFRYWTQAKLEHIKKTRNKGKRGNKWMEDMKTKEKIMEENEINTEVKIWLLVADKFRRAADLCLKDCGEPPTSLPGIFLTSFTAELYLKAYLFLKCADKKTYREVNNDLKKMGHDISSLLNKCKEYNIDFEQLEDIIKKYQPYSFVKYPDELYKIIYSKDGYEVSSNSSIDDLNYIKKFIENLIPEEIKNIDRSI